jgi:hypothetical protein
MSNLKFSRFGIPHAANSLALTRGYNTMARLYIEAHIAKHNLVDGAAHAHKPLIAGCCCADKAIFMQIAPAKYITRARSKKKSARRRRAYRIENTKDLVALNMQSATLVRRRKIYISLSLFARICLCCEKKSVHLSRF